MAVAGCGGRPWAARRVGAIRPLPARHEASENGAHPRGGAYGGADMRLARAYSNSVRSEPNGDVYSPQRRRERRDKRREDHANQNLRIQPCGKSRMPSQALVENFV